MKLRPENAPTAPSCVRCGTQPATVRAICSPCNAGLSLMHVSQEYTMFRRTYYACSLEGTSLDYLLANGYAEEIRLPTALMVKAPPVVQVLEGSG